MTEAMREPRYWQNIDKARPESAHYSIMALDRGVDVMSALRAMFPDAKANVLNFVLFSTSGIHGTYNTIEEAEQHLANPTDESRGDVTFLVVHPRLVALRYGCCIPENAEDIAFLKALRDSSHKAAAEIGRKQ